MTANTGLISTTKELVTSYLPISLNLLAICNKMKIGESYHSLILFWFQQELKKSLCVSVRLCGTSLFRAVNLQSRFLFLRKHLKTFFFLDFSATSSLKCYVFHRSTLVASLFHAVISFLAKLFVLSSKQTVFNFIIKLSTN